MLPKRRAASGFRPKMHSRAESSSLESLDMSRAVGREFLDISKFYRESLNMGRESLDIPKFGRESLNMGRESLEIPKFGRKNLDMGRESLNMGRESLEIPKFGRKNLDMGRESLLSLDFRGQRREPCPDFPDSNSRRDYAIWV